MSTVRTSDSTVSPYPQKFGHEQAEPRCAAGAALFTPPRCFPRVGAALTAVLRLVRSKTYGFFIRTKGLTRCPTSCGLRCRRDRLPQGLIPRAGNAPHCHRRCKTSPPDAEVTLPPAAMLAGRGCLPRVNRGIAPGFYSSKQAQRGWHRAETSCLLAATRRLPGVNGQCRRRRLAIWLPLSSERLSSRRKRSASSSGSI